MSRIITKWDEWIATACFLLFTIIRALPATEQAFAAHHDMPYGPWRFRIAIGFLVVSIPIIAFLLWEFSRFLREPAAGKFGRIRLQTWVLVSAAAAMMLLLPVNADWSWGIAYAFNIVCLVLIVSGRFFQRRAVAEEPDRSTE